METQKLLTVLVGVTLVLGLVNLYGVYTLSDRLDGSTGAIIAGNQPTQGGSAPTPSQPAAAREVLISADDDPVEGSLDAPVTVIEFSDFECPFCGRFYDQTLGQIRTNYVDTGKAKLVYRDFPLSFHAMARPAALAAQCADEQGKFWEFHDKIFDNQASLSEENLLVWAAELDLDTAQFGECVSSEKYGSEVDDDFSDGSVAGITGTPGFLVFADSGSVDKSALASAAAQYPNNIVLIETQSGDLGARISGALPYSAFSGILDALA